MVEAQAIDRSGPAAPIRLVRSIFTGTCLECGKPFPGEWPPKLPVANGWKVRKQKGVILDARCPNCAPNEPTQ